MGLLHYDATRFEFDDRTLAHLQIVIGLKLRRREPFYVSWRSDAAIGSGRHSLWIDNGVPIHFEYSGGRIPAPNRDWIEHLVTASNSSAGLNLSDDHNREPNGA